VTSRVHRRSSTLGQWRKLPRDDRRIERYDEETDGERAQHGGQRSIGQPVPNGIEVSCLGLGSHPALAFATASGVWCRLEESMCVRTPGREGRDPGHLEKTVKRDGAFQSNERP
jgi:hypothetical protein